MKVKVTVKQSAINSLLRAQADALSLVAAEEKTETIAEQVMPFQEGTLQNESTYVEDAKAAQGEVQLISDTPYARRLYFHPEYDFSTTENANARGEWWEEWIRGSKRDRLRLLYGKLFRKKAGGYVK